MTGTTELLLRSVRPYGQAARDILISNGKIAACAENINAPADAMIIDGAGQILLPGLVDAHAHVDKTLMGRPWFVNDLPNPTLRNLIDFEREYRLKHDIDVAEQAGKQVRAAAACGVTHIRTHVDIDTEAGLRNLEGVVAAREKHREIVDMQIVAFPQSGLLVRPGTRELLDEALKLGADLIGGLDPCAIDRDPVGHLDTVFALAVKHDVDIDIHLHETGELGGFSMELLIERVIAHGYQGRVTVSHSFCLGTLPEPQLSRILDALAEARINIMSLGTGKGEFPPLKRLAQMGISLCTGTDGIQDTWSPNNVPDLLERVRLLAYRSGIRHDQEFEWLLQIATADGARLLGAHRYGLEVGHDADLFLVGTQTITQAIIERPSRSVVLKRGKITAMNGLFRGFDGCC